MNAAYFIAKFEAIPEEQWAICMFIDTTRERRCASGHCRNVKFVSGLTIAEPTAESDRLHRLFRLNDLTVFEVNDGLEHRYPQPTPKQRVLAALRDIQAKGY